MKDHVRSASALCLALSWVTVSHAVGAPGDLGACAPQKESIPWRGGFGSAVAMEGTTAIVGARNANTDQGTAPGAVFVYELTGTGWAQRARIVPSGSQDFDQVGQSLSLSGTRLLFGAPGHDPGGVTNAGAAYVYERQGDVWVQDAKLVASDPIPTVHFGDEVAIDGDFAVIGVPLHPQMGGGAAYVFERVTGTWVQRQRLASSELAFGDSFGRAVAIQGETIVVGAPGANGIVPDSGAAYVFQRTPGGWLQVAKLQAFDGGVTAYFGVPLAIEGSRIAVGAPSEFGGTSFSGAIYTFERDGAGWSFRQKLKAPDPGIEDAFGAGIALSWPRLLTGAPSTDERVPGSGSAYLFEHDGTGYVYQRKLRAETPGESHFFGDSVALSNGQALIGAYGDNSGCPNGPTCGGAAWFFELPEFVRSSCFGSTCPCGNKDRARGCRNSLARGASLSACGSASVAEDSLAFTARGLIPGEPALLFQGTTRLNGGAGLPFGDGLRCVGGEVRRLALRWAGPSGAASFGPGLAAQGQWQAGETLHLQVWYRDPTNSPCSSTFNTTDALHATLAL